MHYILLNPYFILYAINYIKEFNSFKQTEKSINAEKQC